MRDNLNKNSLVSLFTAVGLFFQAMKMKQTGIPVAMMPRPVAMNEQ